MIRNILFATCILFTAHRAAAQSPSIVEFSQGGHLTISNAEAAVFTVEWSPSLVDGDWSDSWDGLSGVLMTSLTHRTRAPLFYRAKVRRIQDTMRWVPGGVFAMGNTGENGGDDELPVHPVGLSGYWIDMVEVTFTKWTQVREWGLTNGYAFDTVGEGHDGAAPATRVHWCDSVKWCNARSESEGYMPAYYTDSAKTNVYRTGLLNLDNACVAWTNGYRLPTEAEWEYAATGGPFSHGFVYAGSSNLDEVAWYRENASFATHAAATKGANELGIHDMSGNVWELCWDRYAAGYYTNSPGGAVNPRGPATGEGRVVRGGAFPFEPGYCRTAERDYLSPVTNTSSTVGFRTVRALAPRP